MFRNIAWRNVQLLGAEARSVSLLVRASAQHHQKAGMKIASSLKVKDGKLFVFKQPLGKRKGRTNNNLTDSLTCTGFRCNSSEA